MRQNQRFSNSVVLKLFSRHTYQMLTLLITIILLLDSNLAVAAVGKEPVCPSNTDRMYYIGTKSPTGTTPSTIKTLDVWPSGKDSKIFDFNNGLKLNLSFVTYKRRISGYPKYVANDVNNTIEALVMEHSSELENENHVLESTINKPVTKYGFVAQDVDYQSDTNKKYRETFAIIAPSGGVLSNTNVSFHTILGNKASAYQGSNCNNPNRCDINVDWPAKPADTIFRVSHGNDAPAIVNQSGGNHAMGYSDFYLCLAQPKLTVIKKLDGLRFNDTNTKRDQFEIKVTGDLIPANSFETTGDGANIINGTSSLLSLAESTSYTITEQVKNGTAVGDIANYNPTYTCTNKTTTSTTVMPTAAMANNTTNKTRSFTLSNVTYGDDITCTITNTPKSYTFSGTVFNDNAGIAENNSIDLNINTKSDISSTFTSNPKYFNGIFDQGESGISATGLTVSLTNCDGTNITGTTAQLVGIDPLSKGQYKFIVPGNVISSLIPQKVCLVQNEPSGWEFSVDTTPNSREVALVSNIFDYKTESNRSRNLDFGEVKANYSALVLIKSQYVHDCNDLRTFTDMPQNPQPDLPTNGFSTEGINGIVPGQCIAYKIEAHNRGHLNLESIQIEDKLQINPVKSVFHLPFPISIPNSINNNINILPNSKIISNQFSLEAVPLSGNAPKATLYFNTKYGTTTDP